MEKFNDKYIKYIEEKDVYECLCCMRFISEKKLNRHIFSMGHKKKEDDSNNIKKRTRKHFFKKQKSFSPIDIDESLIIRFD